jgi:nucleoside-diphosphate kinase
MAMVWEGPEAVAAVRQTMGATKPTEADPGTIRHDFGLVISRNLTHASDSPENARSEISLWFSSKELVDWTLMLNDWITKGN